MSKFVCLETDEGEAYINLEQICVAEVRSEEVHLELCNGEKHKFTNSAAHALLQALRHEERMAVR